MMRLTVTLLFIVCIAYGEHFSASISKSALDQIIKSGIDSYSESQAIPTYVIPSQKVHLKISKEEINNYEIVSEIKKYVNIDLSKDFNYSLSWSPMTVEFRLKKNNFKYDFEGNSKNFTVWAKAQIKSLRVSGANFEICEILNKECIKENGAYVKIKNFNIELKDRDLIDAVVALNIKNSNDKVLVRNTALYSSLFTPNTYKTKKIYSKFNISNKMPKLNINFSDIIIPAPVLTVGNKKVKLNTSGLKTAILSQREFLASQLLHIVGEFISTDLSSIVTEGVMGDLNEITKRIDLFDFSNSVVIRPRPESAIDKSYVSVVEDYKNFNSNISNELLSMVLDMINHTEVDLEYLGLRPSDNESLAFDYNIHASLNNRVLNTNSNILNGLKKITNPQFSQLSKKHDVALAIGEPFLNGILDSAVSSGIVTKIFEEKAGVPGLDIKNIKIHFDQRSTAQLHSKSIKTNFRDFKEVVIESTAVKQRRFKDSSLKNELDLKIKNDFSRMYNTGTFTVVANVELDLSEMQAVGIKKKFKNFIASTLESNLVWFPIEIQFRPVIKFINGISHLSLKFIPNKGNKLLNSYSYPMKDMYSVVEEGIVETLKETLFDELSGEILLDISNYIQFPGLRATPVGIEFLKSGHMGLLLNINDLNLKELVDYIGGM